MLEAAPNREDGARVWKLTYSTFTIHIADETGEPSVILGEIGPAAGLHLSADVVNVLAPLREIMALLRLHATAEGVALLFALAGVVTMAPGVTDRAELAKKLLLYSIEEVPNDAGGVRLLQHLGLGPAGIEIVRRDMAAAGVVLH